MIRTILRLAAIAIAIAGAYITNARAAFVAKPSWTMSATFVITNTGNVNIGSITWTPGFKCPRTSLNVKNNTFMQCTKTAGTKTVIVKGIPTSGKLLDLMWSEVPPTQPPAICYLTGNNTYLTSNSGERLTCQ